MSDPTAAAQSNPQSSQPQDSTMTITDTPPAPTSFVSDQQESSGASADAAASSTEDNPGSSTGDSSTKAGGDDGQSQPPADPVTVDDLTMPEGYEPTGEAFDGFLALLNNRELSPAQLGSELLRMQAESINAANEAAAQEFASRQDQWREEIAALPKLGGENLNQTRADITRFLRDTLPDETERNGLLEMFSVTGLGNHPALVKLLAAAGASVREPSPVNASPAPVQQDHAARMYTTMNKG